MRVGVLQGQSGDRHSLAQGAVFPLVPCAELCCWVIALPVNTLRCRNLLSLCPWVCLPSRPPRLPGTRPALSLLGLEGGDGYLPVACHPLGRGTPTESYHRVTPQPCVLSSLGVVCRRPADLGSQVQGRGGAIVRFSCALPRHLVGHGTQEPGVGGPRHDPATPFWWSSAPTCPPFPPPPRGEDTPAPEGQGNRREVIS